MSAIFEWLGAPKVPLETGKVYRVLYALPGDCAVATDADVADSLTPAGWSSVVVRQRDQAVGACRVLVEQTWPGAPTDLDVVDNPFGGPLAASSGRVVQVVDVGTGQTIYDASAPQTPPQTPHCRPDQALVNNVCVDLCKPDETWNPTAGKCEPKLGPPPVVNIPTTKKKTSILPWVFGGGVVLLVGAILVGSTKG